MNRNLITDFDKITITGRWILRGDTNYPHYCLYNIDTRKMIELTPALFLVLKIFYENAISFNEVVKYLNGHGVHLPYSNIADFLSAYSLEDAFCKSSQPVNAPLPSMKMSSRYTVPVMSSPMDIELHLTHNCNLRCKHCFQSSEKNSDRHHLLSIDEWKNIFLQMERTHVLGVIISGGEPLVYPHATDLLREVSHYKMSLSILTNGTLINKDNIDIFSQPNVSTTVSLDGESAYIHEFLRGNHTFQRTEDAIRLLLRHHASVNIAHTIHRKNREHLELFIQHLIELHLPCVSINFIEPEGRAAINSELILSKEEEKAAYEEILELSNRYAPHIRIDFPSLSYKKNLADFSTNASVYCAAGTKRLAISSSGIVYPCVYAFDNKDLEIGDLKRKSLQQLWEDTSRWTYNRGNIMLSQIETCSDCRLNQYCSLRNCRIKYYTPEKTWFSKPHNCLIDKL